ncbi:MAG TPA: Maf family protein [Deltaproteobacteria bacterium]|jgi:septum formation protein|nr:Maf family protein [Deltaproteobacteria bacterium]HOI06614.1 Maf family protein [Deltaproteobacteria bacterium]
MQILLASGSPRRRELISWMGIDFEVLVPEIDETLKGDESPEEYCSRLSREKALAIQKDRPQALVIAADTVVVAHGTILGKPAEEEEARKHLRQLQGAMHEVYTSYTIAREGLSTTRVIRTRVYFRDMTEDEIAWYVSTGEPMDKAGSYALQGIGAIFVDRIEGSYTNVIGLPLSHLYHDLKEYGITLHLSGEV